MDRKPPGISTIPEFDNFLCRSWQPRFLDEFVEKSMGESDEAMKGLGASCSNSKRDSARSTPRRCAPAASIQEAALGKSPVSIVKPIEECNSLPKPWQTLGPGASSPTEKGESETSMYYSYANEGD
jgi:hypothetical protein